MIELTQNRTYNAKIFLADDGKKVLQSHVGHIHYKDGEEYKPISWDLVWDDVKRGWGFKTHSFHPFFPEYSDGWVEFNDLFQDKNQTVKYKAVCSSVKGELVETDENNPNFDDNPDNKGVLYRNAFGEDKDYLLYHTRSSMVKVATVNNPNKQTEDVKFRWEIQLPDKNVYRAENKEAVEKIEKDNLFELIEDGKNKAYKLDTTKTKKFDSAKQTLIGNTVLDGKEWFTYLRSFKAWDSKGKTTIVESKIFEENGKLYLEKTIPLSFLQSAEGRVFTDTTTSYYSGSGDGYVASTTNGSWSDIRGASGTGSAYTGSVVWGPGYWGTSTTNTWDDIQRGILQIDTSAIPDTDSISAATLYVYGWNKLTDFTLNLTVAKTTTSSNSTLTNSDYNIANWDTTALTNDTFTPSTWSTAGYNAFSFNAYGLSKISKTGYTTLGLIASEDLSNSAPTWPGASKSSGFGVYMSEQTGTSNDPYISITYSEAAASTWVPKVIIF